MSCKPADVDMDENTSFPLSTQEIEIIRDLVDATEVATGKNRTEVTIEAVIGEKEVRILKPVFDLFQIVQDGKSDAVSRVTGMDGAEVISAYHLFDSNTAYSVDDVLTIKFRMQGYLKELALHKTPPRTLYIADCHFYHRRLNTEMDNRGFSSVEEMNEYMIQRWNAKVTEKDTVYILGDLSLAGGFQTSGVLECLKGKKHLIIGNHDDRYLADKFFEDYRLRSVQPYAEIHDKGRNVILSHYPVFCYKGQYRKDKQGKPLTYMLYGHVHNSHDEVLINRFIAETKETKVKSAHATQPELIPCNMINCFCMFSDYQPMTLDEWIEIDRKRRKKMKSINTD